MPRLAEAKKKRDADEAPAEAVDAVDEAPAAPAAPPLFPDGLPVDTPALPDGLANLSAQGCNACHFAVHDAWSDSAHAHAWDDPIFQEALTAAGNAPVCSSCHLPLANQQAQLVVEYTGGPLTSATLEDNPAWDATLQQEGVTCAACHVRDGQIVSTSAPEHAPHPIAVSDELSTPEFCATCHQLTWPGSEQPFYDTFGEWSRSSWAAAGVRCQDCHMPPSAGPVTAGRFAAVSDHRTLSNPARAVSLLVELPPGPITRGQPLEAMVRVQNTGAGHAFPTGSPFRYALLEAAVVDAEGEVMGEPVTWRFARDVSPDPPFETISDTRLPAGGQHDVPVRFEVPAKGAAGDGSFRVRLYRAGPDHPDGESAPSEPIVEQRIPVQIE